MDFVLKKLDRKLPHTAARRPNLEFIRQNGLEAFLNEQEKAWKCPQCGSSHSWYLEKCGSCGKANEKFFTDRRISSWPGRMPSGGRSDG